ncbi:MAG: AraC family transcriptional regulator [Rivularia sp. ALOHA_DT_140]|nr:AraC family transcriptional regulator [Rivularia sp. ALOHA_DT_140]
MPEEKPLIITKEDEINQIFPRSPILSSQNMGWDGVSFRYMFQPVCETPEVSTPKVHSIAIFTFHDYVIHADRTLDGRFQRDSVVGGDIVITPANTAHKCAWDKPGDFILINIDVQSFARTVEESNLPEQVQLTPHFATPDPLVLQIGLAIKDALQNNPSGSRLYVETMVNALSVHLLQYYSARKPNIKEYIGGLSKRQLNLVKEYIQNNLDKDLGLNELSFLLHMSPHYFCHLFKQSTGMTPHQYIIQARVNRAKELILTGQYDIAQIAVMVGFSNQSHLNRHFKKFVGITPGKFGK